MYKFLSSWWLLIEALTDIVSFFEFWKFLVSFQCSLSHHWLQFNADIWCRTYSNNSTVSLPCLSTLIHSPKLTTERSPSLPRLKRFSEDSSANEAKRKKEKSEPESLGNQNQEVEGKHHQLDLIKQSSSYSSSQRLRDQLDGKVWLTSAAC